jgi:hypothetical protein
MVLAARAEYRGYRIYQGQILGYYGGMNGDQLQELTIQKRDDVRAVLTGQIRSRMNVRLTRRAPPSHKKDVTTFVTRQGGKGRERTGVYRLNGTRQDLDFAH